MHPALSRITRSRALRDALEALSVDLSGADFATFMLEVARRRATRLSPSDLMERFRTDRFVQPGQFDVLETRRVELQALGEVCEEFELVESSPLAPLGTSSVISGISQDRVVSTARSSEVNSDPTTYLALEAARRRQLSMAGDAKSRDRIRLASSDRVVRAQLVDGALSFAHFSLLGLVSAGRDEGNHRFEVSESLCHIRSLLKVCATVGLEGLEVRLSQFDGRDEVANDVAAHLGRDGVAVSSFPDRELGRGYYPGICFKVYAQVATEPVEVGDGGAVAWTQLLLANHKERLMISGLGLERVAALFETGRRQRP